jgi:hypothetical protein
MFLDRIEDLNIPFSTVDENGGFTPGNTQKLLSKCRERWAKTFGLVSLGKMLKGTGIALVAVVDDERFAAIKADMRTRKRRPNREVIPAGSMRLLKGKITKKTSQKMQELRSQKLTPRERSVIARRAARIRWRRERNQGALLAQVVLPPSDDGKIASPREC